ncbi:MAG: universal stress protein [Chloroflexi bacterium]|nr:universal stress protein [Chloroflexota bacterium]
MEETRYEHILVPLDGSEVAAAAIPHAAALARAFSATITLFHVVPGAGVVPRPLTPQEKQAAAQIDSYLQKVKGELETQQIEVHWAVTVGRPAQEIVRYAHEHGVDMVVISSHGKSAAYQRFFGSVANEVLGALDIPVVILRPSAAKRQER